MCWIAISTGPVVELDVTFIRLAAIILQGMPILTVRIAGPAVRPWDKHRVGILAPIF